MGANAETVRDAEPSPGKASLWEDFVDILYNPSSVFARRASGQWGKPLLFMVIAAVILAFLTKNAMQPIMDAEFARRSAEMMRRNPNLTAEQLSSGRGFIETLGPIFFGVVLTISILGTGLVLWLVGKLFDAKEAVAAALMIAVYSEVPRIVQIVVQTAQALFMSPDSLNSVNSVALNLARFMDPDRASPVAIALASRVDVFTIWVTVLLAIGLHVVGKVPKQQAGIAAAIIWLIGGLAAILPALRA
ncbi:MAG TPA: YIP1 family protein [Gemmatimonadaceae bacterium]|nr:YIP1 family protein [Gemmatimonadaceae bacterium]